MGDSGGGNASLIEQFAQRVRQNDMGPIDPNKILDQVKEVGKQVVSFLVSIRSRRPDLYLSIIQNFPDSIQEQIKRELPEKLQTAYALLTEIKTDSSLGSPEGTPFDAFWDGDPEILGLDPSSLPKLVEKPQNFAALIFHEGLRLVNLGSFDELKDLYPVSTQFHQAWEVHFRLGFASLSGLINKYPGDSPFQRIRRLFSIASEAGHRPNFGQIPANVIDMSEVLYDNKLIELKLWKEKEFREKNYEVRSECKSYNETDIAGGTEYFLLVRQKESGPIVPPIYTLIPFFGAYQVDPEHTAMISSEYLREEIFDKRRELLQSSTHGLHTRVLPFSRPAGELTFQAGVLEGMNRINEKTHTHGGNLPSRIENRRFMLSFELFQIGNLNVFKYKSANGDHRYNPDRYPIELRYGYCYPLN